MIVNPELISASSDAEHQAVEQLREEIRPIDHSECSCSLLSPNITSEPRMSRLVRRMPHEASFVNVVAQVYEPRLQPNAPGACISGRPGSICTIS